MAHSTQHNDYQANNERALSGVGFVEVESGIVKFNELERETFLHGKCGLFAIALSKVSGLPIYGTFEHDNSINKTSLVHAYIRVDEDTIIDINGTRDKEWALQSFPGTDTWEEETSVSDILKVGGGVIDDVNRLLPQVKQMWDSGELDTDVDDDF